MPYIIQAIKDNRMPRVIRFELPSPTPLLNVTLRMHWATAKKKKDALARDVAIAMTGQIPIAPFAKAHVLIERMSVREPDYDGAVGGCKWLIDTLLPMSRRHPRGLGIVAEDNQDVMQLEVRTIRVPKLGDQMTRVTITEILA